MRVRLILFLLVSILYLLPSSSKEGVPDFERESREKIVVVHYLKVKPWFVLKGAEVDLFVVRTYEEAFPKYIKAYYVPINRYTDHDERVFRKLNDFKKPFTKCQTAPFEPTTAVYFKGEKVGEFEGRKLKEKLNALLSEEVKFADLKIDVRLRNLPSPALLTEPFLKDNEKAVEWMKENYGEFTIYTTEPHLLSMELPGEKKRIRKLPDSVMKRTVKKVHVLPVIYLAEGKETFLYKPLSWGGEENAESSEERDSGKSEKVDGGG